MAVAFVTQNADNLAGATAGTSSTLTVTPPTGLVAGNVLVAFTYQGNNVCGLVTSTGWALAGQSTAVTSTGGTTAGAGLMTALTKVVTGSEPASYVFTFTHSGTSQSDFLAAAVLQYSGVNTASTVDGTPAFTSSGTAVTTINAPTVTAAAATVELVAYASFGGNSFSTPAGTVQRSFTLNSANISIYVDDKSVSAGATGTTAATQASSPAVAGSLLFGVGTATLPIPDLTMAPFRR